MFLAVQCGWYWGAMGLDEAEAKLASKADGTFLVRDSSDERYILSLSFRSLGGTHHTRIEHYKGTLILAKMLRLSSTLHLTFKRFYAVSFKSTLSIFI